MASPTRGSGSGARASLPEGPAPSPAASDPSRSDPSPAATSRRFRWAEILQRVFAVDALRCPRCGSTLRLVAAIEDPAIARRILECVGLPARAPPVALVESGPDPIDSAAADPDEASDFDQTPPDEDSWV